MTALAVDWPAVGLGVESDGVIARRLGVAHSTVAYNRSKLGIQPATTSKEASAAGGRWVRPAGFKSARVGRERRWIALALLVACVGLDAPAPVSHAEEVVHALDAWSADPPIYTIARDHSRARRTTKLGRWDTAAQDMDRLIPEWLFRRVDERPSHLRRRRSRWLTMPTMSSADRNGGHGLSGIEAYTANGVRT